MFPRGRHNVEDVRDVFFREDLSKSKAVCGRKSDDRSAGGLTNRGRIRQQRFSFAEETGYKLVNAFD